MIDSSNSVILCKNILYVLQRGYNKKNITSILTYIGLSSDVGEMREDVEWFTQDNQLAADLYNIFSTPTENFENELQAYVQEYLKRV